MPQNVSRDICFHHHVRCIVFSEYQLFPHLATAPLARAMVGSWRDTWLAPAVAGTRPADSRAAIRYRLLLLSCIFCGLIQKLLIAFAWDMQEFEDALYRLHGKKANLALMGGTAILLRQVFASPAQNQVKTMALALARAGTTWKRRNLQSLLKSLWWWSLCVSFYR